MTTTVNSSRLRIFNSWDVSKTGGVGPVRDKQEITYENTMTDGDGDNQAEETFHIRATLPTKEEHSYDLAGGVENGFGDILTFAEIKELQVINNSTTDGDDLNVGGNGSPTSGALLTAIFRGGNDAGITVPASGAFVIASPLSGFAVTGGSADILRIYNSGTGPSGISYDLIVKGVLA